MGRVLWQLKLEVGAIKLMPQTAYYGAHPASTALTKCYPQLREGKAGGHLSIKEKDALGVSTPLSRNIGWAEPQAREQSLCQP